MEVLRITMYCKYLYCTYIVSVSRTLEKGTKSLIRHVREKLFLVVSAQQTTPSVDHLNHILFTFREFLYDDDDYDDD